MNNSINFTAGSETLAGLFVRNNEAEVPNVLFLHGAGNGTKERALPIAEYLQEQINISSFLFDFSGHGQSSGTLSSSSIAKRVLEAEAALQFFDTSKPFSLVASSMGGHIALTLMKKYPIQNVVLLYPGIYTDEAFGVPFTNEFSEIIRKHESWRDATVPKVLRKFEGNLLIIIGEQDTVIPHEVIETLKNEAVIAKTVEELIIPNGTHWFLEPTLADPDSRNQLCEIIARCVV